MSSFCNIVISKFISLNQTESLQRCQAKLSVFVCFNWPTLISNDFQLIIFGHNCNNKTSLHPYESNFKPRALILLTFLSMKQYIMQYLYNIISMNVKRSVNPEIVKNIARCYFLIITMMYIKVYISGMGMSQRIHFWYQIWPKMLIFWENGKKLLFLKKFLN